MDFVGPHLLLAGGLVIGFLGPARSLKVEAYALPAHDEFPSFPGASS